MRDRSGTVDVNIEQFDSIMGKKMKPTFLKQLYPQSICSFYIYTTKIFKKAPENSSSYSSIKASTFLHMLLYPVMAILLGFNQTKGMNLLFFTTVLFFVVHFVMRIILALTKGYNSKL